MVRPVMLRLTETQAELLQRLTKDWIETQPTSKKTGRPATISAYVGHLLQQQLRARRPGYVQYRLTTADRTAASELDEISKVEVDPSSPTVRRVLHPYGWAARIAGRILQSKGPRIIARHVDRWVCLDYFGAWLPPRDGMEAHRVPHDRYLSAVWQLKDPTDRPFYYTVGELTSLRSQGSYNWGR